MLGQKFCIACGRQNREQASFCGGCGRPFPHDVSEKETFSEESLKEELKPITNTEQALDKSDQNMARKETMKSLSSVIVIVALLGLLVYTNPTREKYENFLHQRILQESQQQKELGSACLGSFLGGLASRFIASQTIRKDYIVLSLYETNIGNESLSVLGILNNFIVLEEPQSAKSPH